MANYLRCGRLGACRFQDVGPFSTIRWIWVLSAEWRLWRGGRQCHIIWPNLTMLLLDQLGSMSYLLAQLRWGGSGCIQQEPPCRRRDRDAIYVCAITSAAGANCCAFTGSMVSAQRLFDVENTASDKNVDCCLYPVGLGQCTRPESQYLCLILAVFHCTHKKMSKIWLKSNIRIFFGLAPERNTMMYVLAEPKENLCCCFLSWLGFTVPVKISRAAFLDLLSPMMWALMHFFSADTLPLWLGLVLLIAAHIGTPSFRSWYGVSKETFAQTLVAPHRQ